MSLLQTLATLICVPLCLAQPAFAIKPVRCDGRVQFSTCKSGAKSLTRTSNTIANSMRARPRSDMSEPKVAGAPYAEVVKTSYTPAGMDGQWRGVIKGNGNVHLTLQILRRGVVESTRYMGHIFLNNKSTIFAYRSVPPKGRDWDWRIFAMAR